MIVRTASIALLLSFAVRSANAQSPAVAGNRVRFEVTADGTPHDTLARYSGRLVGWSSDTLLLATERNQLISIASARIRSFELSNGGGWKHGANRGVKWGFVGGTVLGALTGALIQDPSSTDNLALNLGITGAILGPPIGAVFGAIRGAERWRSAAVPNGTGGPPGAVAAAPLELPAAKDRDNAITELRLNAFQLKQPIRLLSRDGHFTTGKYGGVKDGLARIDGDAPVMVPTVDISQIFEQHNMAGHGARTGLKWGAIVGGVTLGALGALFYNYCEDNCDRPSRMVFELQALAYGAGGGAAIGGFFGLLGGVTTNRWQPQPW